MRSLLKAFLSDESGTTAVEYVLIAAVVSLAGFGALGQMGGSLETIFGNITTIVSSAANL